MARFTIEIEDKQIEKFVNKILTLIKNTPGVEFIKEGDNYTFKSNKAIESPMLNGSQYTWEELVNEIELSESDFQNGDFMTSDQLRDEIKSW